MVFFSRIDIHDNLDKKKSSKAMANWTFPVPTSRRSLTCFHDRFRGIPDEIKAVIEYFSGNSKISLRVNKAAVNYIDMVLQNKLTWDNFKEFFYFLLYAEEYALEEAIKSFDATKVEPSDLDFAVGTFSFELDSILDECPKVIKGDLIYFSDHPSQNEKYPANVTEVKKAKVTVMVRDQIKGKVFNGQILERKIIYIWFTTNKMLLDRMRQALEFSSRALIRRIFPKVDDEFPERDVDQLSEGDLFDKSIYQNEEQLKAINHILAGTSKDYPYILFGPPGTGKTVAVAEAIKQVYTRIPGSTIIVTAQSNCAVDLMAERLVQHVPSNEIVRVYSWIHDGTYHVPKRLDRVHEFGFGSWNRKLVDQRIICLTLTMCSSLQKSKFLASHVFVDEAAQASEPEIMIALAGNLKSESHIILSGDPYQLNPVVRSSLAKEHGLEVSMMERLMKCPIYRRHKTRGFNPMLVTKLRDNFRSHEVLLEIPNRLFYRNQLRFRANPTSVGLAQRLNLLPNKGFPIVFHQIQTVFQKDQPSPSVYNLGEKHQIFDYVDRLLGEGVPAKCIGIVTPYKKQRRFIKEDLELRKLNSIMVGSAQEFQGQERPIVILSTVRSSVGFNNKPSQHLGFLTDAKRFNVLTTRAKSLLIVIGDAHLLIQDKRWELLINFCKMHNSFVGNYVSRSEFEERYGVIVTKKKKKKSNKKSSDQQKL